MRYRRLMGAADELWHVDDSMGRDHGVYDRETAEAVLDRIWIENPDIDWVCMLQVPPFGMMH